ncbi:MAG: redox-regulated ATPase YchF [Patescibacteria group bacterium]
MSLSIGIVGLPNVGKSTLFNALTKNNVLAANYPFATIEPNTGIVPLPDPRVEKLGEIFHSEKVIPATVTFVDIAGIVEGASKGEGMGNAFLSHIREVDAIAQVVRAFEDDDIQHVSDSVHPERDIAVINTELILADLQTIESHIPKLSREAKGDKEAAATLELLEKAREDLESEKLLGDSDHADEYIEKLRYLNFMTLKPFIYVFNLKEDELQDEGKRNELTKLTPNGRCVFVSAKIEFELSTMDANDAAMFLGEYGLEESGLERLSSVGFETLGLQTYLTAGPKESKAWTIKKGWTAPQAAGVIHTDFERGFIAADIVSFEDMVACRSLSGAKTAGKCRTEGKDYAMQDGDVVEFKFNV